MGNARDRFRCRYGRQLHNKRTRTRRDSKRAWIVLEYRNRCFCKPIITQGTNLVSHMFARDLRIGKHGATVRDDFSGLV
jgi:hypothetical protein